TILSDKDDRPEFMDADRIWSPPHTDTVTATELPVTLLINLGKRDKISKGDILGFLTKQAGLNGPDVGRIDVDDRFSTAVLTPQAARTLAGFNQPHKIKGHRFRPEFLS
ncbi:MAG: DbpA RNA binding domain-containing protein, partial [Muribaculaceae bacterium]|nr:DbpA RNA binding domain-containing protein [Muribaculaceae bacterium]